MRRKTFLVITMTLALALMLGAPAPSAWAQATQPFVGPTPQVLMPGKSIPQFVDPLPTLTGTGGLTSPYMELKTDASSNPAAPTDLYMKEFVVPVLPSTAPTTPAYTGTHVFGYRLDGTTTTADTYIGPVFVTSRGTPSAIKYINNLGSTRTTNLGVWKYSIDQTLHWANPNNLPMFALDTVTGVLAPNPDRLTNYDGPIPAVPHKHGGEEPAAIDGGPDAWFLSDPSTWGTGYPTAWDSYDKHGQAYYSFDGVGDKNYSIYTHLNQQEAGPLWFHDHLLGGTRVNVYCGLAGAALQTDPALNLPAGLTAVGLDYAPVANPGTNTSLTIPLVLQDRMFDTAGELFFPDAPPLNPEHPFWIPEFVGDTVVVNGKSWPYLTVDPKRYRFLMINGSNARFYELSLGKSVPIYVIGTDGGFLDTPVMVNKLVIGPGERYQFIIDFGKYAGKTILMTNTGRTPFPKGAPPQGSTLGNIIQFRVNAATAGFVDNSYNPGAVPVVPIRSGTQIIQRLVTPPGSLNTALTGKIALNRQLTLNEVMGPGGPLEILVNNTKWSGTQPITPTATSASQPIPGFKSDGIGNYLSELPAEGTTEVWEIINLTADAHPIHTHLVQFQILGRQNFNVNNYMKAYNAAFPAAYDFTTNTMTAGGAFVPAFGPPLAYNPTTPVVSPITGANIVGGNPDVTPYLQNKPVPADPNEQGWKDTAIMYPGQVTRIAVRFSPLDTPPGTVAYYPFTPNDTNPNASAGDFPNYDYVWHCHIVDHEDNEMMRPYQVDSTGVSTTRTYNMGTDY